MSTVIKAILMRDLLDRECIEGALKELGYTYEKMGNKIEVNENISINMTKSGTKLEYVLQDSWQNIEVNSFIEKLTRTYTKLLEEKIERLKLEEARMGEAEALREFAEEERKQREMELRKERMRLEAIKRKEESALQKQIKEKVENIRQKAQKLGYILKEEIKGKERIMVLVRR